MELIKKELRRNCNKKFFIVAIIVIILLNLMVVLLDNTVGKSMYDTWQENAKEVKKDWEESIKDIEANEEFDDKEYLQELKDDVKLIDYCLKNNIPYAGYKAFGYMRRLYGASSFVLLVIILHLLMVSYKNKENAQKKEFKSIIVAYISKLIIIAGYYTVFYLVGFIIGIIGYGFDINEQYAWIQDSKIYCQSTFVVFINNNMVNMLCITIFVMTILEALNNCIENRKIVAVFVVLFICPGVLVGLINVRIPKSLSLANSINNFEYIGKPNIECILLVLGYIVVLKLLEYIVITIKNRRLA